MTRNLFTLCLTAVLGLMLTDTTGHQAIAQMRNRPLLPEAWSLFQACTGNQPDEQHARTTAIQSRMIAHATDIGTPTGTAPLWNMDSTVYRYSGLRGTGQPDSQYQYLRTTPGAPYNFTYRRLYKYDPSNFLTEYIAQNWVAGAWKSYSRTRNFPDALGADTLSLNDTFNTAAAIFSPYTSFRYEYYDSRTLERRWTLMETWNKDSLKYLPSSFERISHNAAGKRTGVQFESWFNGSRRNVSRDSMVYSTTQRLIWQITQTFTGGSWRTTDSLVNIYDSRDSLELQIRYGSSVSSRPLDTRNTTRFSYDARGNLTRTIDSETVAATGIFRAEKEYRYTYTTAGRRISHRYDFRTPRSVMSDSSLTVFVPGSATEIHTNYTLRASGWTPLNATQTGYNARGQSDTIMYSQLAIGGDSLRYNRLNVAFYDSLDRFVRTRQYIWMDSLWSIRDGGHEQRYYYEVFDDNPVTAQSHTMRSQTQLNVFPVPADQSMSYELELPAATGFSATILDAGGRKLRQWQGQGSGVYRGNVPVRDLAPGYYVLLVRTASGDAVRTFTVSR